MVPYKRANAIESLFYDIEKETKYTRVQWARKICYLVFSKVELASSNILGILGSKKLNEEKLTYLKRMIFNKFPCEVGEDEMIWRGICRVINEVHRNVKKHERKKLNFQN